MQNKNKIIVGLIVLICGCGHYINSSESWIDYNSLSSVSTGLSQEELKESLGEPLLVLGNNDNEENRVYLFYNYRVKRNLSKNNQRDSLNERKILIKFTFENNTLVSWDEDNITLNMSRSGKPGTGLVKYINLIINLVLLGAVFGGS